MTLLSDYNYYTLVFGFEIPTIIALSGLAPLSNAKAYIALHLFNKSQSARWTRRAGRNLCRK